MWYDLGMEVMDILLKAALIVAGSLVIMGMVCAAIGAYVLSRSDKMKP